MITTFSSNNENETKQFYYDISAAFIAANIPMKKLNNKILSAVLEKYCKKKMPEESTLRKNYLPKIYDDVSST